MKKFLCLMLSIALILSLCPVAQAAKVGSVIGTAYNTDIVAYINHYAIPSYAVNGTSCIVAEDLRNFGFDVTWDGNTRSLSITRNSATEVYEMNFQKNALSGTKFANLLSTDISVYANGTKLTSYAINGYTIIPLEELTMFGNCYWVESERAVKLWVDGVKVRSEMQEIDNLKIFSALPYSFTWSSGVGSWYTGIEINADGSFTGVHNDMDMGSSGYTYPGGTIYTSEFKGKFSAAKKINEYIYTTKLEYLIEEPLPSVRYDGVYRIVRCDPYGFTDADMFYIYLPGTPVSEIPDEFFPFYMKNTLGSTLPDGYFGLYNVNEQIGFISVVY